MDWRAGMAGTESRWVGRPQLRYDPEADALYASISPAPKGAKRRIEVDDHGIILDMADDILIGVEVLTVRELRPPAKHFPKAVASLVDRLYKSGAIERRARIVIDG